METCGTNIVDCLRKKNIVAIASGQWSGERVPQNALIEGTTLDFASNFLLNSFWEIDFKRYVIVTSYSILALPYQGWIYNWNVNVSSNHKTWKFIHQKTNTECSASPSFSMSYNVPIRYLRIITAGNAIAGGPNIAFQYISFKGSINYTPIPTQNCFTQNKNHHRSSSNILVYFIVCTT